MSALFRAVPTEGRRCPRPGFPREELSSKAAGDNRRLTALMRASQNGDRAAYISLLQELVPVLQRLMRNRLRFMQATDREDLVQDVLLSLHVARAKYDSTRPFMPWLMRIARNRMIDGTRRRIRLQAKEVLVDELAGPIPDGMPDPAGDGYGDPEALRRAVNLLPSRQRKAIELVKLRELSLKEAADLSGMSMGALKVSVHRGIKSLRSSLLAHVPEKHAAAKAAPIIAATA